MSYRIEAASKEEWAERCFLAEDRAAKLEKALRHCKECATGSDMMPTSVVHSIVDAALSTADWHRVDDDTPQGGAQEAAR